MTVKAVEYGSTRWNELVSACQLSVSERNWLLGDAALEIAPFNANNGGDRKTDQFTSAGKVNDLLDKFAEEVGVNASTLIRCRYVSAAWPKSTRTIRASWSAYYELRSDDQKHLLVDGMTQKQAGKAAGYVAAPAAPEQAEKFTEAVNKEVAKAVERVERQSAIATKFAVKDAVKQTEAEAAKKAKQAKEIADLRIREARAKAEQQAMLEARKAHQKAEEEKAKAVSRAKAEAKAMLQAEERERQKEAAKAAEAARAIMNDEERREFDSDVAQYLRAQKMVADSRFAMSARDYQRHIAQTTKINDKHTMLAIESASA